MESVMRRLAITLITVFVLLLPSLGVSSDTKQLNEPLPAIEMPLPKSDFHLQYLGLANKSSDTFLLSEVDADILIIELFSMYCPYCQKEAPLVNELFEKMRERSKKGIVIKILGIGASNSQFEVDHFGETYNVPFPLFPDKDMSKYKKLSGAGTPGFIGCSLNGGKQSVIVLRNSGGFYDPDEFLDEVISNSGL